MRRIISIVAATEMLISCVACGNARSTVEETVQIPTTTITEQVKTTITTTKAIIKERKTTQQERKTTKQTTTKVASTNAIDPYIARKLPGKFSLTFYVADETWGYYTATPGVYSQHLATCAVDPNVIPLGSVIRITGNNGVKLTLHCVDVGGGIRGNKIDIFWNGSVAEGYKFFEEFGTIHDVYLLEE